VTTVATTSTVTMLSAVLGLMVGSFLNVVIWRVPRGESVVRPPSACPGCGHAVRPRDNVPVLSWVLLRGRCRDCSEPISARYPLVEAGTAALFALTAAFFGAVWHLPAFLYLAAVSVCLALIDVDVKRLPDAIVLPSYAVGAVLLGGASLLQGDADSAVRAVAGTAILFGAYFLMALAYPAGMGFGDVKLAGVLGMYLGWLGWSQLAVGSFAAFLVGGLVGVAIVVSGRGGRKTAIPFGPYMLLGAYVGIVAGDRLADLYLGAAGL
jgi:leader peptidase (prepilin peptidase)/N-methyltransferase